MATVAVNAETLSSAQDLLAGNALFTVTAVDSGERYTFHFIRPATGRNKGQLLARLLTGPSNTKDYSLLGVIDPEGGDIALAGPHAVRGGKPTLPASVARYMVRLANQKADVPAGLEVTHAGRCLACGRVLTVPYPDNPYRLRGLGPICGGGGEDGD